MKVIYAIKIKELSYGSLKIVDVKIGQTQDVNSTLRQYRRANSEAEILDLWESNDSLKIYNCEKGIHKIAEKYAYQNTRETFIFLQESYAEFSENVSLILRSIGKDTASSRVNSLNKDSNYKTNHVFTGKKPTLIRIFGKEYPVKSWIEVLIITAEETYKRHEDFERALRLVGKQRPYFTKNQHDLRKPRKINNSEYYFETNLNAEIIVQISKKLLEEFGYTPDNLEIHT